MSARSDVPLAMQASFGKMSWKGTIHGTTWEPNNIVRKSIMIRQSPYNQYSCRHPVPRSYRWRHKMQNAVEPSTATGWLPAFDPTNMLEINSPTIGSWISALNFPLSFESDMYKTRPRERKKTCNPTWHWIALLLPQSIMLPRNHDRG